MKIFAKFDEIPSITLQDIKETKRYRHTFVRSFVRLFGRTDNVKTVYPPTNTVCGGYKYGQVLLVKTNLSNGTGVDLYVVAIKFCMDSLV